MGKDETKNLLAGAAKAEVQINSDWLPLEQFNAVANPLTARALFLKSNEGDFLLVSLEMTSLLGDALTEFRAAAAQAAQIQPEQVWISVTHTFSVPHFISGTEQFEGEPGVVARSAAYKESYLKAACMAAASAARSLTPVRLAVGSGASAVNANRDIETSQGWWIGINPCGLCDRNVNILRLDDLNGRPIAVLWNYAVQSSILDHVYDTNGFRVVSGDLAGEACRRLEERYEAVALFLPGASGDQCPRQRAVYDAVGPGGRIETNDLGQDKGFEILARLSQELAEDVSKAYCSADMPLEAEDFCIDKLQFEIPKQIKQFEGFPVPTKNYRSISDGTMQTSVEILRIGKHFAIVGVLPELNTITGHSILHASTVPITWIAQMINGGQKYVVDVVSFDRGTYGAMNGFADKGAAEKMVRRIAEYWCAKDGYV